MSLWKIAWRSIQQRGLASSLTALSVALGVALVVTVLVLFGAVNESFRRTANGYDLIVGAKGSPLQLVLNTVFHISRPIENLPYSYYKEFTQGRFSQDVLIAIPFCMGDHYEGFRVVGTVPKMFDEFEYAPGVKYHFAAGRNFEHEHFFEAVIGAGVARSTGLGVGDTFEPTHGITHNEDVPGHTHDAFTVVGVLQATGTPNDRALFVNMEGFYLLEGHARPVEEAAHEEHEHEHEEHDEAEGNASGVDGADGDSPLTPGPSPARGEESEEEEHDADGHAHHAHDDHHHHDHGHAHEHHEPLPEAQREVTAVLIRTKHPLSNMMLRGFINEGQTAQAVSPIEEVTRLLNGIIGNIRAVLLALAVLIVVVAGIGILVSIYNSMNDRRREIAIMRSLGAGRGTVLAIVLLESILLSLGGGMLGFLLGHGLIAALSPLIVGYSGVPLGFFEFSAYELILIPGLIALASLVGFLPALSAYRTDVSRALSATG